jgi:predicted MFS family arabinose efflux permease
MLIPRIRVLAVFSSGYFLSFLFRGVNLGYQPFLIRELGFSGADIGLLTSAYFLGFAAAQLPAGVLLDRFGPRRVTACFLLFAAGGSILFGLSDSASMMFIARFFIGVGGSICLGGAFKATAQWFPHIQLTAINGMVMAIGALGGVVVGTPLNSLLTIMTWRSISIGLGLVTVAVALTIWIGAPRREAENVIRASFFEQLQGTWHVMANMSFWKLITFSATIQAVFFAMQSLWIVPFLNDVSYYDGTDAAAGAASVISTIGIAFILGNLGFGLLARVCKRRGVTVRLFSGLTMVTFVVIQILIISNVSLPKPLVWFSYGALGSTGILTYSVLADHFPGRIIGRVNTTFTLIIFAGVFIVQTLIGRILAFWPASNGHLPVHAHQVAWYILISIQLLASLWYFLPGKPAALMLNQSTQDIHP